jgi:hypothetical protein
MSFRRDFDAEAVARAAGNRSREAAAHPNAVIALCCGALAALLVLERWLA